MIRLQHDSAFHAETIGTQKFNALWSGKAPLLKITCQDPAWRKGDERKIYIATKKGVCWLAGNHVQCNIE